MPSRNMRVQNKSHYRPLCRSNLSEMYSGAGSNTGLEIQTFLVSSCGRRSHDQSQNTTLHGGTDGCHNTVVRC